MLVRYITIQARRFPEKSSAEIYKGVSESQMINPLLRSDSPDTFSFILDDISMTPEVLWSIGFFATKGRYSARFCENIRLQVRPSLEKHLHFMCENLKLPLPKPTIITNSKVDRRTEEGFIRVAKDFVYWELSVKNADFFEWLDSYRILDFMQGESLPDYKQKYLRPFAQGMYYAAIDGNSLQGSAIQLKFYNVDVADRAAEILNSFNVSKVVPNGTRISLVNHQSLVQELFKDRVNFEPRSEDSLRNIEECHNTLFFDKESDYKNEE